MPVYLLHGFRWPRSGFTGIRVHVIVHNLDDCSAEYIQNAHSQAAILDSFRKAYPDIMKELDGHGGRGLTMLEQYDPKDVVSENAVSQPWAFVGDRVVTLAGGGTKGTVTGVEAQEPLTARRPLSAGGKAGIQPPRGALSALAATRGAALSVNIEDVVAEGPGLTTKAWEALADLRDKIAEGEKIGWWVVYNGDPERAFDEDEDEDDEENDRDSGSVPEFAHGAIDEGPSQSDGEKTIIPREDAKKRTSPTVEDVKRKPLPNPKATQLQSVSREMPPPPPKPPVKDKGKRVAGMKAPPEKLLPPEPPKPKVAPKSDGLKKKLFGRKGLKTNPSL